MNTRSAVAAIEKAGILLTFPIQNRKEPASLWTHFFPRSRMRWEWDDSGDTRVAELWQLRTELSASRKVVYAKWYQGRATFFSRPVFTGLLASLRAEFPPLAGLDVHSRQILDALELDSPLSSKILRRAVDLEGKDCESTYQRALKALWQRLSIVGFGEVDDGAFPSLAIGATEKIFEDLWHDADTVPDDPLAKLPPGSAMRKQWERHWTTLRRAISSRPIRGEIRAEEL